MPVVKLRDMKLADVFGVDKIDRNGAVEALNAFEKLDCAVNPSRSRSDVRCVVSPKPRVRCGSTTARRTAPGLIL